MPELTFHTLDELYTMNKEEEVILIYGESGTGKSLLTAQFPDILVLGCDPGTKGGMPRTALPYNPKMIKINSFSELNSLLPTLKEEAGKSFKCLGIDSISFLQKMVMKDILTFSNREIPRFDEWNLNSERMKNLLTRLCEIPATIVMTALPGSVKDEVTGKITGGPDLPGKLAGELARYCSLVVRLYMRTSYNKDGKPVPSYRYTVVGDDTWYAKDRTGLISPDGETNFEAFKALFKEEEVK